MSASCENCQRGRQGRDLFTGLAQVLRSIGQRGPIWRRRQYRKIVRSLQDGDDRHRQGVGAFEVLMFARHPSLRVGGGDSHALVRPEVEPQLARIVRPEN